MQFRIHTPGAAPDLDAVENALLSVDPAALVDIEPATRTLRIAATVHDSELLAVMSRAGMPVTLEQIEHVPSECCGGCGG